MSPAMSPTLFPSMLDTLFAVAPVAAFADVFKVVIGVLLSLAGLGLLVMGAIAVADKAWKSAGPGLIVGLVLLVGGLFLVGALP